MKKSDSILLVEDNQNDISLILSVFETNEYKGKIDIVNNGEDALDYLYYKNKFSKRTPYYPSLILLDIKIPKISGLELLKKIKKDLKLKKIPVVMFTSSNQEEDIANSYEFGANAYVIKPVDFNSFNTSVKEIKNYWTNVNLT